MWTHCKSVIYQSASHNDVKVEWISTFYNVDDGAFLLRDCCYMCSVFEAV